MFFWRRSQAKPVPASDEELQRTNNVKETVLTVQVSTSVSVSASASKGNLCCCEVKKKTAMKVKDVICFFFTQEK